ncbi:hypothetical protein D3C86_1079300 [compost metagenome]
MKSVFVNSINGMTTLKLAGSVLVVDIKTSTPYLGFGYSGLKAALYLNFKTFVPITFTTGEMSKSLYDVVGNGNLLPWIAAQVSSNRHVVPSELASLKLQHDLWAFASAISKLS